MNTTDDQARPVEILAGMVGETIRAAGTRTLLSEVARDLITTWARKGGIRKKVSSPALWLLSKVLSPERNGNGNGISADAGRLLTAWAKKVNTQHAGDPTCHAQTRVDSIHAFLKNTDFGEIREMVEGSGPCVLKTVEAFNEHLWKYPAKVGSILATVLSLVNTGIRSGRELLKPIEEKVGPDLLADLILSLLKGFDAREAANLVNSISEFIRRLHTGNYLLAHAGKPLFQVYLTQQLRDALPHIDPALLKKARIALAEDREAVIHALADALSENSGILLEFVSAYGSSRTPAIRGLARKIRLFEEAHGPDFFDAVARGLSDLDTYEIAEVVNGFFRLLNSLHDARPEVLSSVMNSIVDSVDPDQVSQAARWFVPELIDAARPLLEAALPSVIQGITEVLNPHDGIMDEDHIKALQGLREMLVTGGEG